MTVKIAGTVRDYPGRLFVEIPERLREKAGLESGDIIQGTFDRIKAPKGGTKRVTEEVAWEVGEFTHMLIVPRDVVEHHEITPGGLFEEGDEVQLTLKRIIKKDGTTLAV